MKYDIFQKWAFQSGLDYFFVGLFM